MEAARPRLLDELRDALANVPPELAESPAGRAMVARLLIAEAVAVLRGGAASDGPAREAALRLVAPGRFPRFR